jgi:signal peptidase I
MPRDNYGPIVIPENKYFVIGDNYDESFDSRFFGFVSKDEIIGKAIGIYFSAPEDDFRKARVDRVKRIE